MRNYMVPMVVMLLLIVPALCVVSSERSPSRIFTGYHNAELNVNVTFPNSAPAVGYVVQVSKYSMGPNLVEGTTNSEGKVMLNIPPLNWGQNEVVVFNSTTYQNGGRGTVMIEPDGVHYLDLVMNDPVPKLNTITGRLRNSTTNQVLEGIEVLLTGLDEYYNYINLNAVTGPDGRYSIKFPNMSAIITVQALSISHHDLSRTIMFIDGQTDYVQDMTLTPIYVPPNTLQMRYYDRLTMNPILTGTLAVSGYRTDMDHTMEYGTYLYPDGSGWFSQKIGPGEYSASYTHVPPGMNVTVSITTYHYINSTDRTIEVPVRLPVYKLLEVNIWNGTAPQQYASVSYSDFSVDGPYVTLYEGASTTAADGRCYIGIPEDRNTLLNFNSYHHSPKDLTVDPDMLPLEVNVTLDELAPYTPPPEGAVRIIPTDIVTGFTVPGSITATQSGPGWSSSHLLETNQTGVFDGKLSAGFFSDIEASTSLGRGTVHNVTITESGPNPDIIIPVERSPMIEEEIGNYSVRIVDDVGNGIPGMEVYIYTSRYLLSGLWETAGDGTIEFPAPKGVLTIQSSILNYPRSAYTFTTKEYLVDGSGGDLSDIVAYPTDPLESVYGHVLDSLTGETVDNVNIDADSAKVLSGNEGDQFLYDPDDVLLFRMMVGSDPDGFYRVWGMEDLFLRCTSEGYFPYYERIDMAATRALEHDILMDPVPDLDTYVNGTIVDGSDAPVKGFLQVFDRDHPGMLMEANLTGDDGKFSLLLYVGNFTIVFGNGTLTDEYQLDVDGDISGLILRLVPKSQLTLHFVNWSNEPAPGVNVVIVKNNGSHFLEHILGVTSLEGSLSFDLEDGEYAIWTEMTDLYMRYMGEPFTLDGWEDKEVTIVLENRTLGDVVGKVTGIWGPYPEGIPLTSVSVLHGVIEKWTLTNENGSYRLTDVPFGEYALSVIPPPDLIFKEGIASGYETYSANVTISSIWTVLDLHLQYRIISSEDYLNVTFYSPIGTDVPTNAPIFIEFSHAVNRTTLFASINIEPPLDGANVSFSLGDTLIMITHDNLLPNTTYSVILLPTITSIEGYPMYDIGGFNWSFTTRFTVTTWELYSTGISSSSDNTLNVHVRGLPGMDLFIVIDDVGSFELMEEEVSAYSVHISPDNFEWDTEYTYHFSNVSGGPDLAPSFAGSFQTPEPEWSIWNVDVTVEDDKDWKVTLEGNPGLDIYIIIDGVGSFELGETSPGVYSVVIKGNEFDWDKEYSYHFSDTDGGAVVPGYESFSGTETTPEEPSNNLWWAIGVCSCLTVLVLLLVILALVVVISRKGGKRAEGWEE